MPRARAFSLALIAMGVLLAAAASMELWVGIRAERVSDLVRPELTDAGLRQHRTDFETASAVVTGLDLEVLPAIANSLQVTPEQLFRQVETGYPAVGRLLNEREEIVTLAEAGLTNLERQQADFQRADRLPVSWLPGYSFALLNLVLAAAVITAGWMLYHRTERPNRHLALGLAFSASATLIVLPLTLGIPGKASSAQSVLDSLNPTQAVVDRTEDSLATAQAANDELNQRLIPDLSTALRTTPEVFQQVLVREFPETGAGLQQMPDVLRRYDERVAIRTNGAADLRTLKAFPVGTLGWFGPAFGLLLAAITAGAGFKASRPGM